MADARRLVSRQEIQMAFGVAEDFLVQLEREDIVVCEDSDGYSPKMVERIRVCQNLHDDLGVNFAGLEVAIQLLDTIQAERYQFRDVLNWLRAQLEDSGRAP